MIESSPDPLYVKTFAWQVLIQLLCPVFIFNYNTWFEVQILTMIKKLENILKEIYSAPNNSENIYLYFKIQIMY